MHEKTNENMNYNIGNFFPDEPCLSISQKLSFGVAIACKKRRLNTELIFLNMFALCIICSFQNQYLLNNIQRVHLFRNTFFLL